MAMAPILGMGVPAAAQVLTPKRSSLCLHPPQVSGERSICGVWGNNSWEADLRLQADVIIHCASEPLLAAQVPGRPTREQLAIFRINGPPVFRPRCFRLRKFTSARR